MSPLTIIRKASPFVILLLCWALASMLCGPALVPAPGTTALKLLALLASQTTWSHVAATLLRGLGGLALAAVAAYVLGIPCGLDPRLLLRRDGSRAARAAGMVLTLAVGLGSFVAIHVCGGSMMAPFRTSRSRLHCREMVLSGTRRFLFVPVVRRGWSAHCVRIRSRGEQPNCAYRCLRATITWRRSHGRAKAPTA